MIRHDKDPIINELAEWNVTSVVNIVEVGTSMQ